MNKEKVLVFSIALEGYSLLFRDCIKSHREYCDKFGLEYVLVNKSERKLLPIEAAWLKIFLLRAALQSNKYSWVAFIDADCEIRNFAPLFINDFKKYSINKYIFMAHGFSGRINSGVIFIKNNLESLKFLNTVISNGDIQVPKEDDALYENGHMIHFGKNNPIVQIIEAEKWNNNHNININSSIQHYSGGILREQYLKLHPYRKSIYFIRKRLKQHFLKFSSQTQNTTMLKIDSLIPYFKNKYYQFASDRKMNSK
jgi:hypothetical protein